MNDSDIKKLFEKFKDDENVRRDFDVQRSWTLVSKACGFDLSQEANKYGARDYIEYYIWQFTHATVKPLVAGIAVFAFLIAGWAGAAGMSFDALPGDKLYNVKIATERAELALAFGNEHKSALKAEFASRRLEEMIKLTADSYEPGRVQLAVERFRTQVNSLTEGLKDEDVNASKEVAKVVGRKTQVYRSTVQSAPEEVASQVEEILNSAEDEAVNVIITAYEETADEDTTKELMAEFEKRAKAFSSNESQAIEQEEKIILARKLAEQGAFRRAFQLLQEIELGL